MSCLPYYIPFGYFVKTRLNTKAAILFHGYAEFLLGVVMLILAGYSWDEALLNFALAYLAFISFYEIGYIYNDFISVLYEENPRKRIAAWSPSKWTIVGLVVIRLVVFLFVTWKLTGFQSLNWGVFYVVLGISFLLHNILQKKELKILTFLSLALLRFYAPLFFFLEKEMLVQTLPGVLIFYTFFRTITYMDSKGLLNIPNRNSLSFKTSFYLLLLPLSVLLWILTDNWFSPGFNGYFLIFWGGLWLLQQLGILSFRDLKTE